MNKGRRTTLPAAAMQVFSAIAYYSVKTNVAPDGSSADCNHRYVPEGMISIA